MSTVGIPRTDLSRVVSLLLFKDTMLDDSSVRITSLKVTFLKSGGSFVVKEVAGMVAMLMTSLVGTMVRASLTVLVAVEVNLDGEFVMVNM